MDKKMTLDEEMMLWKERDNDFFGIFLSDVEKELDGCLLDEITDFGLTTNYIKDLRTRYALDGVVEFLFDSLCYYLQDYDYCNLVHPTWSNHVELAKKVRKFAKTNNLTIKIREEYL